MNLTRLLILQQNARYAQIFDFEQFRDDQADALIVYKTNRLDRSEWGVNLLILLQELKSLGVEEQIKIIKQWASIIADDLRIFRKDFESRRLLVKMLDVRGSLVVEGDEKAVYVTAKLTPNKERLSIETKKPRNPRL